MIMYAVTRSLIRRRSSRVAMTISSRTPEGEPNCCPLCGALLCLEPSQPLGDAPCPTCGHLLWFNETSEGIRVYDSGKAKPLWVKLREILSRTLGLGWEQLSPSSSFIDDIGADSLDIVELVMELEEQGITIPQHELENMKTVGDVIDYITRHYGP